MWLIISLPRFGEISALWQNLKSFRQFFGRLFIIWHTFEPTLTNIVCLLGKKLKNTKVIWSHCTRVIMSSRNLLAHDLIVAISVGSAAVVVFVIILFVLWKFCLRKKAQQRQQQQQQQTSKSENKSFDQVKQHLLFTRQIVDYVEAVIGRLEIYYNCKI